MEKIKIINKSLNENKRFSIYKFKNNKYNKIGDYFKNETEHIIDKSSEKLNGISEFYEGNLQSYQLINNDKILSIPDRKFNNTFMSSKDNCEYINIFRNNIKKSFFKVIKKNHKDNAKKFVKFKFHNSPPFNQLTNPNQLSLFKTREMWCIQQQTM